MDDSIRRSLLFLSFRRNRGTMSGNAKVGGVKHRDKLSGQEICKKL